jgi:glycosyltransferase involved in cell wall biosynthesis
VSTLALCIPAYNAAGYLPKLLNSASNQAIPFDEILVYNDCSIDDTASIAEKLGAKVIQGDVNRGCSHGKNVLAQKTACDWIHFHDADDDLMPNFTKLVHEWVEEKGNEFEVLLLNFNYTDFTTGELLGQANHNITQLHADPLKYAINNKIVNFGVYKRHAFLNAGGFDLDENVLYNEDNAFHQNLAKHLYKFDYLQEVTCVNYRYPQSMSASNVLRCLRANYHVLEKTAATHGNQYPFDLARQLWYNITLLAARQDWVYTRKTIALAKQLGYGYSPDGSGLFKVSTRLAPFGALWLREKMIRLLKPHLRDGQ